MTSSNVTLKPQESHVVAKVINFLSKGSRNSHSHICKKFANGNVSLIVSISETIIFDVIVAVGLGEFGIKYDGDAVDYYWEKISHIA